ncbi:MAG: hypothetical protein ACTSO7_14285 [Candidatus Heimdallarchaeota archaeon]
MNRNFSYELETGPYTSETHIKGSTGLRFSIGQKWEWEIDPIHPLNVRMGVQEILIELSRQSLNGHKPPLILEHYFHEKMTTELEKLVDIFNTSECRTQELLTNCYVLVIMKILNRLDEIDVGEIVSYIQSFQDSTGGFKDSFNENKPTIYASTKAVVALNAVGAEPLNRTGVRDFVYSLQDTTSIPPSYEFKNYKGGGSFPIYTRDAKVLLDILGYSIPNIDKLLLKVEGEVADFVANHSTLSNEEKTDKLGALAYRTLMFKQIGDTMREELFPIAWAFHNNLHELNSAIQISKDRSTDGLLTSLMLMGKADPHLDFFLAPKEIEATEKETVMTLAINNTAYYDYKINITNIELEGNAKNYYQLENLTLNDITLSVNENKEFTLTLNKTTNETIPISLEKVKVRLKGDAPTYDKNFRVGYNYTCSFEIFFEIPLKHPTSEEPKDKGKMTSGAIIGSVLGGGIITGATAGYFLNKKKAKKKE